MKNTNRTATEARAADMPVALGVTLETVRVVRESKKFPFGHGGMTIGQMLDAQIMDALESGDELQDIAVHFESSDWTELRDLHITNGGMIRARTAS